MIIDIHTQGSCYGLTFEEMIANMDKCGIDKTWLLTVETPDNEKNVTMKTTKPLPFPSSINFDDKDHRFIIGYAPDPRKADSIFRMEEAIALYGVSVYGVMKFRMCYDNAEAISMFKFCARRRIPVIVEMEYGILGESNTPFLDFWYGGGIDAFEQALKRCPDTVFFGHSQGFWAHISGDDLYNKAYYPKAPIVPGGKLIKLLHTYDNFYLDLSGSSALNALKRDVSFTKELLDEFQDRTCFGRDTLDNSMQEFLNSLGLKKQILDKIYDKNATTLVPID